MPHTDLLNVLPQIKFITHVRDPVERAEPKYRFCSQASCECRSSGLLTNGRIAKDDGHVVLPGDFFAKLRERNQLDQALFDWIKTDYFPGLVTNYQSDFAAILQELRTLQSRHATPRLTLWIDSIYRNAYIKPLTGLIRLTHGLPYSGSYALTDVR